MEDLGRLFFGFPFQFHVHLPPARAPGNLEEPPFPFRYFGFLMLLCGGNFEVEAASRNAAGLRDSGRLE